jgi:hypothetical protein
MTVSIDHFVIGVRDLEAGARWFEEATGVAPQPGGAHHGRGTRNALVSLGPDVYLELLAVDPAQDVTNQMTRSLRSLDRPRALGWCFHCAIDQFDTRPISALGFETNRTSMSRTPPDGQTLDWQIMSLVHAPGAAVPFLIDWGSSKSPATSAPQGCALESYAPVHPRPSEVEPILNALGLDCRVETGPVSGPTVTIRSARGLLEVAP